MTLRDNDAEFLERERDRVRETYLRSPTRAPSTAQGVHHIAIMSSNMERTIRFYHELLGFPLTDIIENRDYRGSHHFFFDVGHDNLLAFFDMPGINLGPYKEVLGGLHHLAISVAPPEWFAAKDRLSAAGVECLAEGDTSLYFADPDGVRLELVAAPLGEMEGHPTR